MSTILAIGIGVVLGIILTFIVQIFFQKKTKPPEALSIDGLFETSLIQTTNGNQQSFEVQMEFHIMAHAKDKYKIKLLKISCSPNKFNTEDTHKSIRNLHDETWIDKDKLFFLVDLNAKERTDTINNIINS